MQDTPGKRRKGKGQAWKTGFVAGVYVLTAADVTAGVIRLGKARFLYDAKAKGADAAPAEPKLTVEFAPGGVTEAELGGKNRLLGGSGAEARAFLDAIHAAAGDRLLVERTGARRIRISKAV